MAPPPSALIHSLSAIGHLLSALCHLPFAICHHLAALPARHSLAAPKSDAGGSFVIRPSLPALRPSLGAWILMLGIFASASALAQPANDNFANARAILGPNGVATGSNVGATLESGEPDTIDGAPSDASIWFKWTAPFTGTVNFDTGGSLGTNGLDPLDTLLGIYTGTAVDALTSLVENDDADPLNPGISSVSLGVTAGTTYMILVSGYAGDQGSVTLNWNGSDLSAGDFRFTSSVYIFSDFDSFAPATSKMGFITNRFTITRTGGSVGRVLVNYTVTNGFYIDEHITNTFGTNFCTTNIDNLTGNTYFTNFSYTNIVITNRIQNMEYGQIVSYDEVLAYLISCTNSTLFDTNGIVDCSLAVVASAPTNYPCNNRSFISITNIIGTNPPSDNTIISATNSFCIKVDVLETNKSAIENVNYLPNSGTITNEDFQMSEDIQVIVFPSFSFPLRNAFLVASIDSVALDPAESTAIAPPTLNDPRTNAVMNILNSFFLQGGTNGNPADSGDIAFPGAGVFGTNVINFERSTIRCGEGVAGGFARIWVFRDGVIPAGSSASVNYRIDYHPNRLPHENANNQFRRPTGFTGPDFLADFRNPEVNLQPGSEYATPTNTWNFSLSPVDFDSVFGTINFPSGVGGVALDIPINNDTNVEFNEDILVQLYFSGAPPSPNSMSLGYVRDCVLTVLFDEQPAGAVDRDHNPDRSTLTLPPLLQHPGANGTIFATAVQPSDGKTVIGGDFTSYNATLRNRISRMNLDGSFDDTFDPGSGADQFVRALTIDSAGRILVGGGFASFNGTQRNGIARLSSTGSLDGSFNPGSGANGTVWSITLQNNGLILVGGDFTSFNSTNRNYIVRVDSAGNVDPAFDPGVGPNAPIHAMALQADGKIIIGGEFTQVGGVNRSHVARLNADGTLDTTYNIGIGADDDVNAVVLQADGKALIGGAFQNVQSLSRKSVARLNTNGSIDLTFLPGAAADATIYSISLQPDQNIILGGKFSTYNETRRMSIARIFPDGSLDTSFLDTAYNQFAGLPKRIYNPAVESHAIVFATAIQADGNIIIGGEFERVGGGGSRDDVRNRSNVARLIGGSTPGPGNVQLAQPFYSVDENGSPYFLTLNRTNGILGQATVTVAPLALPPGAGSAVLSNDFFFQTKYADPTYISTWAPFPGNNRTWQASDGTDGQNQGASGTVQPGVGFAYPDNDVLINIIDNTNVDGNRSLNLELHNPRDNDLFLLGGQKIPLGVALGRSFAPLTIIDNDTLAGTFGFALANFTVSESGGSATVTVIRTNGSSGNVTVDYATSDGTATAPGDYKVKTGTLSFGPGVTNATFQVTIVNDSLAEDDETINLRLFNVSGGAHLGLSNAVVTIIDNDSPNGRLNFTSATYATNENAGVATLSIQRGAGSQNTLSITVSTIGGSNAVANVDYTPVTNTFTWGPGDIANKTFNIPLLDNQLVDGSRSLNVRLSNPLLNGSTPPSTIVGSISNAVLTILDDDIYGSVSFTRPVYNVRENGGPAVITVQRTSGIAQSITVNFAANGGTAVPGSDYTLTNGVLSFAPGEISKSFTVSITDHPSTVLDPPDRWIGLLLSDASPAGSLGPISSSRLNIIDDETVNEPPGSLDTSLDPNTGFNGDVFALALQTNGMIVVGGDFTLADNLLRNRLARLNPDGSLDTAFSTPTTGANDAVRALIGQTDGRIVIGGFFTNINGSIINHIARLNYDGTSDSTFVVGAGADNNVYALAETFNSVGDRKILVGGAFVNLRGISRPGIARLNDDGTVDAGFTPGIGANGPVYAVVPYPTNSVRAGQVLIGGDFTAVNGTTRNHIARLNSNGSVDLSFAPPSGASDSVRSIALQTDEHILIGGLFTNVNGSALSHIARLNPNGTTDVTFTPGVGANDVVSAITIQPDNRILLGGQFTRCNGVTRQRLTRLNSDGTVDPAINFGLGADNFVSALLVQPDDQIVLGGGFTHYDGAPALHIARIYGRSVSGSGTFEFDAPIYTVNENGTNAVVTIRRRGGTAGFPTGNVSVTITTSNGTAIAGINYSNVNTAVAFPPGEVVQSVNIPVINDFIVNSNRTVNLFLSNPQPPGGPAIVGQISALLIIINDDSAISFASPTYSINEDTSLGSATISVLRSGSTVGSSSVDFFTTTNGTAVAGVNYSPVTNTLVFAPGQTSNSVHIPVFHDPAPSGDKTVSLVLSNAVGSILLAPSEASLTIIDIEQAPGLFVFSTNNYFVGEGDGSAPITIIRTNGRSGVVSVHFATANASAIAGVDYATTNGNLVFGDGETVKTFNVPILDNTVVQNPRTLNIILSAPSGGASIGPATNAPLTIIDNDVGLSLSAPAYSVSEGAGAVTISVLRLNGSNGVASVQYATTNGSAIAGADYVSTSGTLSFANGETFKTFAVPILQDSLVEGNETFTVSIFNVQPPGAAQLVTTAATVTIVDDDPAIFFASNGVYTVSESGTNILLTVLRTNATALGTNSITFFTTNGTATAGSDYTAASGTLIFTNGETVKTILIPIISDTQVEGNETFNVVLATNSLSGGAQLLTPSVATVTIVDDDSGLQFSSSAYSVNEGGTVTITVLRTSALTNTVTVNYFTSDGSASNAPPSPDYIPASGTLTFTNGETSKSFVVQTIDDTLIEGNETINLSLANPTGQASVINPQAATITIVDNDGSLILAAGAALTFESGPVNGVIDTNETVTLLLGLRNSVGTPTTNLIATLLATNGVTPLSSPQSYGVLVPGGPSASRPFTFSVNGTNGDSISATLLLTDGGKTNGLVAFTFTLGNTTTRYTNSGAITINDNSSASPYPSSITISSLNGLVAKASVTLSNVSHTHPADMDIMLASPGGANMLLMANAGAGNAMQHVNLTFDDAAASYLSQTGPIPTGTNKPTAFFPVAPFPAPAPPAPYSTNLSACSNSNPNGTWSLFVIDDAPVDVGVIGNGWILTLTTASIVPAAADLVLGMSGSLNPVVQNSNLTYTITVTNFGPSAATHVTLTDTLPASATFVSASVGGYTLAGNVLTFTNLGSLPKDGSLSLTITVQPTATGSILNSATVAASESDPFTDDNSASVPTTVLSPSADLVLTLTDAPDPVAIGANLVYTLNVFNAGPATATAIRLTNTLPAGVTFVSATPSGYSLLGSVLTFTNLGDLGSGLQLVATITVHPTAPGNITNSASVGASTLDPFKANNSASAKTVVEAVQLSVQRSGAFVIISWPAAASSYVLESSLGLNQPIAWTQVTTPPSQLVGDQNVVTVGITNASRFFRLRAPAP